jgi:branched-chain amino acid transport system substrate-binding protein
MQSDLFVTSYQNDQVHEILGKHAQDSGMKRLFLIAPNYQAGKDAMAGFKRHFKGRDRGRAICSAGATRLFRG